MVNVIRTENDEFIKYCEEAEAEGDSALFEGPSEKEKELVEEADTGDMSLELLAEYLEVRKETVVKAKGDKSNWGGLLLTTFLPILFLVGIMILLMRQMSAGGNRVAMSLFDKSANPRLVAFEDDAARHVGITISDAKKTSRAQMFQKGDATKMAIFDPAGKPTWTTLN